MSAPSNGRQVSLGPGIPRMDIEPLDLPIEPAPKTEGRECATCGGVGWVASYGLPPEQMDCITCGGSGKRGGG